MRFISKLLIIGCCSFHCKAATAWEAGALVAGDNIARSTVGKAVAEDASVDGKASLIARVYINGYLREYDPLIPFKTFLERLEQHLAALKAVEPIKSLDFSSRNKLTDEFFKRLCPTLQNLPELEALNLCENYLTQNSLDLCKDLASKLPNLRNIWVGGNAIPYVQLEEFKEDNEAAQDAVDKITLLLHE